MTHSTLTMDQVWTDFRALSPEARVALLQTLLTDEQSRDELEDASDLLDIAERRDEPSRPWDEVVRELKAG